MMKQQQQEKQNGFREGNGTIKVSVYRTFILNGSLFFPASPYKYLKTTTLLNFTFEF